MIRHACWPLTNIFLVIGWPVADTQQICTTEPNCLCTGDNACDCQPGVGELSGQCLDCEAPLKVIDCDTGEDVANG